MNENVEFSIAGKITGVEFKARIAQMPDDIEIPFSEAVVVKSGDGPKEGRLRRYVLFDSNPEMTSSETAEVAAWMRERIEPIVKERFK